MIEGPTRTCRLCGRRGSRGFRTPAREEGDWSACTSWKRCRGRQHENVRLQTRATGSIRYAGDTHDRVVRLLRGELADKEAAFEEAGWRGVDLAESIDALRAEVASWTRLEVAP